MVNKHVQGFMEFVRTQGIVGLAIGFILGGKVKDVVTAFVNDLIMPVLGLILGAGGTLKTATFQVGPVVFLWGDFVSVLIDFIIVAAVIYFFVKGLGLDKLDKAKE